MGYNIEESKVSKYIETHFIVMKESLDIIQIHLKSVMQDAKFIEKLLSKTESK